MKKIVINSIPLLSQMTGVGRYTYEISKQLKKDNNFNSTFYYGYFSSNLVEPAGSLGFKNIKLLLTKNEIIKKVSRKILLTLNYFYFKNFDLYWEPNFIPLKSIKSKKTIVSVHDFSFILYKDFHPKERVEYFEKNFFKNIERSDLIICFTEFTKKEIVEKVNIDANKIEVIPHGLDHDLFKVLEDTSVDFELPEKYIFSVGSIEPRKNLIGLLTAYNQLDEKYKSEYSLVLAGFKGWENKEIMNLIHTNHEYIHYLGYISDEELVKAYNLASLFVYPSFYEGFGLPVLEAMACGTPVVTSEISSLPEVGGDAVIYCNPYDVKDIKKKVELVLEDKRLQKEMRIKGLRRAQKFTWEKSVQQHLAVFQEVMKT